MLATINDQAASRWRTRRSGSIKEIPPFFEFQLDAQGKVTGAVLEQQGPQGTQKMRLERKLQLAPSKASGGKLIQR